MRTKALQDLGFVVAPWFMKRIVCRYMREKPVLSRVEQESVAQFTSRSSPAGLCRSMIEEGTFRITITEWINIRMSREERKTFASNLEFFFRNAEAKERKRKTPESNSVVGWVRDAVPLRVRREFGLKLSSLLRFDEANNRWYSSWDSWVSRSALTLFVWRMEITC